MNEYPSIIDGGKRCFCESRGELIYVDDDNPLHPAVEHLPAPEIRELQRPPKAQGSAHLQFLNRENNFQNQNYKEQFNLTMKVDGVGAAVKGLLLYNAHTILALEHLNSLYEHCHKLMPQQVASFFSNWFQKEIPHTTTNGLITQFSWHPKANKIAIALKDDTIKIWYGDKDNVTPLLKHKRQTGVTVLSWKPLVDDILAVGCVDCCILWTIDPSSLSARPGSGCAQVISSPSNEPVHSLSWDPQSSLLALSSKKSTKIEIWDSDREERIFRKYGLTSVAKVLFNPSGDRLLVSGQNSVSVFNCIDWSVETWPQLDGTVEQVCWSTDGDKFIFAINNRLFSIGFDNRLGGDKDAMLLAEFPYNISQLAWHKDRLALTLDSKAEEETQVMLFNTQIGPSGTIRIEFIGWIPGSSQPELLSFRYSSERGSGDLGSILSMIYQNGKIENVPLIYLHQSNDSNKQLGGADIGLKYERSSVEINSYSFADDTHSYF